MANVNRRKLDLQETIYALASGTLPSAVAIIRLSGPDAFCFAEKSFRKSEGRWEKKRGMGYGELCDTEGRKIDQVLLLSFPRPHSFTGEDVIEIQCHGSFAVLERLKALLAAQGIRPAEAGEFTYRAFLNDKLSTEDIENLGDLFQAQDPADLDRIYQRKDDSIAAEIGVAREQLIRLQAILDTAVDFSEEYSAVVHLAVEPLTRTLRICEEIAGRYRGFREGARVPRLVLVGRPNAGKSSLFNALLCRYRAIVHDSAGTTRDAIEEDIFIAGRRWKLVDTAGIRSATSEIEARGIELGADFLAAASYWILVVDGTQGLSELERNLLEFHGDKPHSVAWNKSDLPEYRKPEGVSGAVVEVSARTGSEVRNLAESLITTTQNEASVGTLPLSSQAAKLDEAVAGLQSLKRDLEIGIPPEVLGEKTRTILRTVESVVGEVGVEEVLDRVFGEFCIGK